MTINPLFSIITITRDNLAGFQRTAKSIQAQSCTDYEWIVIDGDSTDGTRNILPQNAISEPDNGIYDAMNKGLERAHGQYVVFLNAGDMFSDPDILDSVRKAIEADRPDFLHGDALEIEGYYKKSRSHRHVIFGMFTHHQAMFYKRDTIGTLRYETGYKIAGDYAFTHAFLQKTDKISYIPAAICIFESGGISQRNMRLGRCEQFRARRDIGYSWVKCACIYLAQSTTATFRKFLPGIYWYARA